MEPKSTEIRFESSFSARFSSPQFIVAFGGDNIAVFKAADILIIRDGLTSDKGTTVGMEKAEVDMLATVMEGVCVVEYNANGILSDAMRFTRVGGMGDPRYGIRLRQVQHTNI